MLLSSNFDNTFRRMQSIADHLKRDVESSLQRSLQNFDTFEQTLPNDDNAYYKMKIKVNNNGHVKVKTAQKEPGKEWDVHVKEYDRGTPRAIEQDHNDNHRMSLENDNSTKSPNKKMLTQKDHSDSLTTDTKSKKMLTQKDHGDSLATTDHRNRGYELSSRRGMSFFDGIQTVADRIKQDVENHLNRTFKMFDVLEHNTWSDPENTYYNMRIKVDDNGHVKVKTARKEPGKDWDVHVEEYDRGNALAVNDDSEKRRGTTSIEEEKPKEDNNFQRTDETSDNTPQA